MDGMKLNKWRTNFEREIQTLEVEFNAFFVDHKLQEFYSLKIDETSQNLSLVFHHQHEMPKELEKRMLEVLYKTQPEDSI